MMQLLKDSKATCGIDVQHVHHDNIEDMRLFNGCANMKGWERNLNTLPTVHHNKIWDSGK